MASSRYSDAMQVQICDPLTINSIPDEVLSHHIFKYFKFINWIRKISPVCKSWKRIVETAKIYPKHLAFNNSRNHMKFIELVKKYQPTSIEFDGVYMTHYYAIGPIISFSKRCDTLVLRCPLEQLVLDEIRNVGVIRFLSIQTNFYSQKQIQSLLQIFSGVRQLHVFVNNNRTYTHKKCGESIIVKKHNLDYFYVSTRFRFYSFGKDGKREIKRRYDPNATESYERYFRLFGMTKFGYHLDKSEYTAAAEYVLQHETSFEYETFLHSELDYKFPQVPPVQKKMHAFYIECIVDDDGFVDKEAYELLVATNAIPVSLQRKFASLVNFGLIEEALDVGTQMVEQRGEIGDEELVFKAVMSIVDTLSDEQLKQRNITDKVEIILLRISDLGRFHDMNRLKKLSLIIKDWSGIKAFSSDQKILKALVRKGCSIDWQKMWFDDDWKPVINYLLRSNQDMFLDFIWSRRDHDQVIQWLQKVGLDLTVEKEGTSLFNHWIKELNLTDSIVAKHRHLLNHMDSNGDTPLIMLGRGIRHQFFGWTKKFLQRGADPTKHRGDRLSLLGEILHKFIDGRYGSGFTDAFVLLMSYGVDVNAPCTFQGRMCSPLMIAVRMKAGGKILSALLTLGADINYRDETGKSVMEYAVESYSN